MNDATAQENEEPPDRKCLKNGGLPEIITPYLQKLIQETGGVSGPIGKQFIAQPEKENKYFDPKEIDPLSEDEYEVAPGLIYKYRGKLNKKGEVIQHGRVLWTVTRFCASYCRFCTRGREVGLPVGTKTSLRSALSENPFLSIAQIDQGIEFLKKSPEINEVILSGGDPLFAPQKYLSYCIQRLVPLQRTQIDVIRIGTRLPIHSPSFVKDWHYQLLSRIKNPYVMVHINHPAEITSEVVTVIERFRRESNATIMSQTVLLKGVNDSINTLYQLFVKLTKEGIRPYYVYQNDPVCWARHFTVPIHKAIRLWQNLRPRISGVAGTARFVIDTPFGFGKIPLPEGNAWQVDYSHFNDFKKKTHLV